MKMCLRVATILMLIILAACGGENDPPADSVHDVPEAQVLLDGAATAIDAVTSLRFTLEVKGTTNVDPAGSIRLLDARGILARPETVDVQFQVRVLGTQTVSIRMITIGEESWTTDIITGKWGPAPAEFGYDPGVLFDTENGLAPVIGAIQNPVISGEQSIDGADAWQVDGTIDETTIGPVTGDTMRGTVALSIWVDKETSVPLRFRLAESTDGGNDDPATWTLDLGNFDEPVSIESPV